MKRGVSVVALLLLGAFGWWAVAQRGILREGRERMTRTGNEAEYRGTEPALSVTFHYPADWRLTEEQGRLEVYREVRIQGPRNAEDTYTGFLIVRSSPLKTSGGRFGSAEELLRHKRRYALPGTTVLVDGTRRVAGRTARELVVTYTIPRLNQPGLKPLPIPVKTRTLVLMKDPYLYELSFSADAREYDRDAGAFERLLKTLAFSS